MNSKKITEALSRICGRLDYRFGTGTAHKALYGKSGDATVWLLPPTLCMVDGRRHGRATYSLTLHVTRRRPRLDNAQTAALLDRMQSDALAMFTELSEEPFVALVDALKIETKGSGLRPDAGANIVVTADVETIF